MRGDLQNALYADFPQLYREHKFSADESFMHRGICTGDGWEPLIRRLSEKITAIIEQLKANGDEDWDKIAVCGVKEKFAELRFDMRLATVEIQEAIHEAKEESQRTCEMCGEAGSYRKFGSGGGAEVSCLCDACNASVEDDFAAGH
ncbi:hypothetical protein BOTBODRAFT_58537 [Botryobasidium botryosum FD-172 SS1]|uniref:Uncharacterized protein n=1 Tax=Botryobasidium botryosum (strain FD-172 SS1) TaxID=930990 RepID=A0A067M232_BOTB1|nr:hypothetical protein BOTBODRAFT_58537 [Botryobasidium botryosum FD-172 SS1]